MASENDIPEREQQIEALLRTSARTQRAPHTLQARVAAMRGQAESKRRRRTWRRPAMRRPAWLVMPITAAFVAVLVLVLGGGAGAPSLAQAAALATRAPTAPAPALDRDDPAKLLTAKVGTLHFPNWRSAGGWRAVGQRFDQLGNRTAKTVYYATGDSRLVYSIVSSPALKMETGSAMARSGRLKYEQATTLWRDGHVTVVWVDSGHTCLLTGPEGMSAASLWRLAFYGFRQPLVAR